MDLRDQEDADQPIDTSKRLRERRPWYIDSDDDWDYECIDNISDFGDYPNMGDWEEE